jgi:hypothetical protein
MGSSNSRAAAQRASAVVPKGTDCKTPTAVATAVEIASWMIAVEERRWSLRQACHVALADAGVPSQAERAR